MTNPEFVGELSDYKIVYNVLKAVSFKEFCIVNPMAEGLKLTVDEMKSAETSVYIPASVFVSYHLNTEEVRFKISLKILIECLSTFEDDTHRTLKVVYRGIGSPLYLLIKHSEENCTVDCRLYTIQPEDLSDINLASECNLNKIVLDAAGLVDILSCLDNSSDEFQIAMLKKAPYLRFKSTGIMGSSEAEISKESELMAVFQCEKETEFSYAFQNIRQVLKVMHLASKISLSTCSSGLLGLQLVIHDGEKKLYVEYYVTSLCDDT